MRVYANSVIPAIEEMLKQVQHDHRKRNFMAIMKLTKIYCVSAKTVIYVLSIKRLCIKLLTLKTKKYERNQKSC